jgi:hypothetical protein
MSYVGETVEQGAVHGVGKITCMQLFTFSNGPIPELGSALHAERICSS